MISGNFLFIVIIFVLLYLLDNKFCDSLNFKMFCYDVIHILVFRVKHIHIIFLYEPFQTTVCIIAKSNNNIAVICSSLFFHDNKITRFNSGINHGFTTSSQDEKFSIPKNRCGKIYGNTAQLPNEQKYDIIDIWKDK